MVHHDAGVGECVALSLRTHKQINISCSTAITAGTLSHHVMARKGHSDTGGRGWDGSILLLPSHLGSNGKEEARHAHAAAKPDCCNVTADVPHGIVKGERRNNLQ